MEKFRVDKLWFTIKKMEVIRESPTNVWFKSSGGIFKEAKLSKQISWFDTYQEAYTHMSIFLENQLFESRNKMLYQERILDEFKKKYNENIPC